MSWPDSPPTQPPAQPPSQPPASAHERRIPTWVGIVLTVMVAAILLFVLSGLIAKTLIYAKWPAPPASLGSWIYASAFQPFAPPHVASLLFAMANLALLYALLAVLHRKRIYLTV